MIMPYFDFLIVIYFVFIFNTPQAVPWGYPLLPLRGDNFIQFQFPFFQSGALPLPNGLWPFRPRNCLGYQKASCFDCQFV